MVLGIDLGTTNSSCAVYDGREIRLVPNERGSTTTPSVVAWSDTGEVLVGESARNQAIVHPDQTVRNVKRLLGRGTAVRLGDQTVPPEAILAHILQKLKQDAELYLGVSLGEAVITVPANFSESQRRSTREAGRLAGLTVSRLLNEPSAAALAWAWSLNGTLDSAEAAERILIVYDLGGGTFDTTVMALRGGDCRVLASAGDNALGGADFDALLMRDAELFFEEQYGSAVHDPYVRQQLYDLVVRAKIELSSRASAAVALPFLGARSSGQAIWKMDRIRFNTLIEPYIEKTIRLVQGVLAEAGVSASAVDSLVFSGGSSRIPLVRERLQSLFGVQAQPRLHPEEIVSYGAAVYAALANGSLAGLTVKDAASRSFGIEIDGDIFIPLIAKNTPIPLAQTRIFTTVVDDQSTVEIHVLQGESPRASENISLGRFILTGIRAGKKGEPQIELEFSIDEDEILEVRARDLDTGTQQAVTIAASPEAVGPVDAERLASLVKHALALADYARGDRSLQAELREAVADAAQAATNPAATETVALTLSTLIAELQARRA